MKHSFFFFASLLVISIAQAQVDHSGVKIGNQTWMQKNLDMSTYRNGDPIPEVKDSSAWSKLKTGAWCYYNNDSANGKIYGKLYNWYAVNDPRGLAPKGWHVPSDLEWKELSNALGGAYVAGGKLKNTYGWKKPKYWGDNGNGTNESGFAGLPGGHRYYHGAFANSLEESGFWWSSSKFPINNVVTTLDLSNEEVLFNTTGQDKRCGQSVRCIKD